MGTTGGFVSAKAGLFWVAASAAAVAVGVFVARVHRNDSYRSRPWWTTSIPMVAAALCVVWVGWSSAALFENGWNTDRRGTEQLYWHDNVWT